MNDFINDIDLQSLRNGSELEFRRLINLYQLSIKKYVAIWIRNPDDVDDIVHETFVTFWMKYICRQAEFSNYKSLLFRIARSRAIDVYRKKKLWGWLSGSMDGLVGHYNPRREYEERRLEMALQNAVSLLPWKDREILSLVYMEKMSHTEIAVLLSIGEEAVNSRIRRARERLKNLLPETFYEEWMCVNE